jgi:hypothetical protein
MTRLLSFEGRLLGIIRPTTAQVLGSLTLALVLLISVQSHQLLSRIGITQQVIKSSGGAINLHLDAFLRSSVTAQIALVTFWAIVGLVAYLICWGTYNVFIEARNEVTLNTTYTNRGHWKGPYQTLALKAVSGIGLAVILMTLWPGFSVWAALSSHAIAQPVISNLLLLLAAVFGLALQLYAVLAFVQLTFTPWYRPEAFT